MVAQYMVLKEMQATKVSQILLVLYSFLFSGNHDATNWSTYGIFRHQWGSEDMSSWEHSSLNESSLVLDSCRMKDGSETCMTPSWSILSFPRINHPILKSSVRSTNPSSWKHTYKLLTEWENVDNSFGVVGAMMCNFICSDCKNIHIGLVHYLPCNQVYVETWIGSHDLPECTTYKAFETIEWLCDIWKNEAFISRQRWFV